MKEEYEMRENNLKEILNENDHESEIKERKIKQLTSQVCVKYACIKYAFL